MLIIGLGHKAKHGKDTFANAVKGAFGDKLDIRLASFADPLRREVREAARQLWNATKDPMAFTPEQALRDLCKHYNLPFEEDAPVDEDYPWGKQRVLHQWWGTEYRRAQNPRYWVEQGEWEVNRARAEGADAFIFRDLRFDNEYDFLGDIGAWRIKVSRLGYVSDVPQHVSETRLDNHTFDLHVGVRDGELQLIQDLAVLTFKRLIGL